MTTSNTSEQSVAISPAVDSQQELQTDNLTINNIHSAPAPSAPTKTMDMDKVSAAMGTYMLQGWAMLNDGCPDCNTPLMRNREATSQICVNCELNPPVDPEEASNENMDAAPATEAAAETAAEPAQAAQPLPPPPAPLSTPAPTAALPSPPPGPRPPSPQNHRASVLDPMMEARRALRPVGSRNAGGPGPQHPLTPPPARSSTPLPMPPSTPPPPAGTKNISGPLSTKVAIPRPAGQPPSLPLAPPPPAGTLIPQPVPRDMRRSPQTSMIISGNILPPTTPPPAPPSSAATTAAFPSPPTRIPSQTPVVAPAPEAAPTPFESQEESHQDPVADTEMTEPVTESVSATEEAVIKTQEESTKADDTAVEIQSQDIQSEASPETVEKTTEESTLESAEGTAQETAIEEDKVVTLADEDEEDKGAESDDDFEDAEEEVYKPTEEEIKERDSKRVQSERASQLIGQKMLQGWAMLQDPCPNPSCHGVPLLRSRDKKEYCVICENYFQREQDLEHGKYTIVSSDLSNVTNAIASTSSAAVATAPAPAAPAPIPIPAPTPTPASALQASTLAAFPPPPQTPSPAIPPQPHNVASPATKAVSSPIASPSMGRSQRELLGRVSGSIILPPAASPSLGMASQQILGKHLSEDLDKLATEDEEARKHIQIIRKVGEFSNKSLPPVPAPALPSTPYNGGSRPISTYSNSSDNHPSENERQETKHHRHHNSHRHGGHGSTLTHSGSINGHQSDTPAPPPVPVSPEVQALVAATHKTIATILIKLEAYRLALEISESPKECQVLTAQIKGLMECLKACRETL